MIAIQNANMAVVCDESGNGLAVIDKRRGTRWTLDYETAIYSSSEQASDGARQRLIPAGARTVRADIATGDTLVVSWWAGQVPVETTCILHESYVEVRLPALECDAVKAISLPGSFVPQGESLKLLLPIMQGMLWDGRGPVGSYVRNEAGHLGFSMSFIGYLAQSGGLLVTPQTREDQVWWYGKDGRRFADGRFWATNLQIASLGAMRYERSLRIYPLDADIVAIARQYRQKVKADGRFKGWEAKIAERPGLERLFGALMCFIGYCRDDVDYVAGCQRLRAYGFDRALVYPVRFNMFYPHVTMGGEPAIDLSPEVVAEIKALGYDVAPWSWLNEALDDGSERIQRMFRQAPQGEAIKGWKIDDQQWYLTCYSLLAECQEAALEGRIADVTWDHFDVLSCVSGLECHALDHPPHLGRPLSRAENRQGVREVFRADAARGLAVSSESFNDAYAADYDLGSVKAWPQYGHWPFWPVPLTMLVYHDSVIHSWWEIHSYNNPWRGRTRWPQRYEYGGGRPRLMAALDALMGCPPDVFPFGAQYGYTGRGTQTFLYRYRFEDPEVQIALQAALPVARLHRRIGKLEMVHFQILSQDGYVQESAFADGTRIVANFSRDVCSGQGGFDAAEVPGVDSLMPESWVIAE